jgi:hypothetical protein
MQPEDILEGVIKLLRHRNRHDLAQLLRHSLLELDVSTQYEETGDRRNVSQFLREKPGTDGTFRFLTLNDLLDISFR